MSSRPLDEAQGKPFDGAQGRRGLLFIVSAPSGTGKTTLVERLVQVVPNLTMSRSYTSRPARTGERNGVDYNFISRERFEAMVRERAFLEWADVFGHYYGTSAADTEALLAEGRDVVLVIDVQGARQVRSRGIENVASSSCPLQPPFWSSGFADAARIPRIKSAGGSRWRAERLTSTRNTNTSSSTTSSTPPSSALASIVLAERAR